MLDLAGRNIFARNVTRWSITTVTLRSLTRSDQRRHRHRELSATKSRRSPDIRFAIRLCSLPKGSRQLIALEPIIEPVAIRGDKTRRRRRKMDRQNQRIGLRNRG